MRKSKSSSIKRERGPGGNVVWTVGSTHYYWNGPGSRLYLMIGDQIVLIEHSSASGSYETSRAAEAAVRRFAGLSQAKHGRKR